MKKILLAAVALICMTMTGVVFTACSSSDNDEPAGTYKYGMSKFNLSIEGSAEEIATIQLEVAAEYGEAINKAAPGGESKTDVSAQVKQNCDAVFNNQKVKWGQYITSGEVSIVKTHNNKSELVADYIY